MIQFDIILLSFSIALVSGGLSMRKYRIIGGSPANKGAIPFQVAYLVDNVPICGGVIISPTVVMTAAHCIKSNYNKSSVLAGTVHTNNLSESDGVRRTIIKTLVHEDYENRHADYYNDIALLFLKRALAFDKFIQPAVLPSKDEDYHNSTEDAVVSGWGVERDYGGTPSTYLKFTTIQLIPRDICFYQGGPSLSRINVICAGSEDGSRESCGGDSGGPLFIGKKVIGLVSYGFPCGFAPGPATYTDISKLRDWIRSNSDV